MYFLSIPSVLLLNQEWLHIYDNFHNIRKNRKPVHFGSNKFLFAFCHHFVLYSTNGPLTSIAGQNRAISGTFSTTDVEREHFLSPLLSFLLQIKLADFSIVKSLLKHYYIFLYTRTQGSCLPSPLTPLNHFSFDFIAF